MVNVPFLYGVHEAPHDYFRYTEFALRRFAAEAGLEVLRLDAVGGSVEVLADLLAKHLAVLPGLGHALAVAVQALAQAFGRTRPGRRVAARSARSFPLGYFMVCRRGGAAAA